MYRIRLVKLCCEIRASEGHEILEARETESRCTDKVRICFSLGPTRGPPLVPS